MTIQAAIARRLAFLDTLTWQIKLSFFILGEDDVKARMRTALRNYIMK